MDPNVTQSPVEQAAPTIQTFMRVETVNGQEVWKTYCKTSALHTDPNNPREITKEKAEDLAQFIRDYQSFKPLLVDFRPEKLGQVIGGNMRLEEYKKMGIDEVWIEPRLPESDADAFRMATLDNMAFGHYVEEKLRTEVHKYEEELGEEIEKLEAALKEPTNFEDLMKGQKPSKHKWEIIIKCVDEEDMKNKFSQIAALGIPLKTK